MVLGVTITDTLIFDFDGTVALGAGPVLAYAAAVADKLNGAVRETFLATVTEALTTSIPAHLLDGYDVVRHFGEAAGCTPTQLTSAYLQSRRFLSTDDAPIQAPPGLAELLRDLPATARAVLVTNAPDIRIDAALERLGLANSFDSIHTSAGKPGALPELAAQWMRAGRVLSIGDIWVNDLAPLTVHGVDTALIGTPPDGATPTMCAATLAELVPLIRRWLTPAHPVSSPPIYSPTTTR